MNNNKYIIDMWETPKYLSYMFDKTQYNYIFNENTRNNLFISRMINTNFYGFSITKLYNK